VDLNHGERKRIAAIPDRLLAPEITGQAVHVALVKPCAPTPWALPRTSKWMPPPPSAVVFTMSWNVRLVIVNCF
jgi:hypothetical protein